MKKVAQQFFIMTFSLFLAWFALSRIDFVGLFNIQSSLKVNEQKLGELLLDFYANTKKEIKEDSISAPISKIKARICEANSLVADSIRVYVIENDEINAFALPGRHMVIYSGLIDACKTGEELAGVMAHEIAHMEKNHVMKKLTKEVGLSMLYTLMSTKGGGEILKEVGKLVSSTAYDRSLEQEADMTAIEYLQNARIDPEHMANFLFLLSTKVNELPKELQWMSTHPDSKERAAEILKAIKEPSETYQPVFTDEEWEKVKVGYGIVK